MYTLEKLLPQIFSSHTHDTHDSSNSNLTCGCNWPFGFPHFKVTLQHNYIVVVFFPENIKTHNILSLNLACGCNWSSRCALFYGDLKLLCIK